MRDEVRTKRKRTGEPLSEAEWPTSGRQLARSGKSLRWQPRPSASELAFKGNRLTRWLGWTLLRMHGWDVCGEWPIAKKMLAVAAPHTCNYDGYLAIFLQMAINTRFSFFIKKEVFVWPLNYLWHWMGGVPVDRSRPRGLIDAVRREIRENEQFIFAVTPEGTRRPPKKLKSGLYQLSKDLDLPILPITFDYDTRTVWVEEFLVATDSFNAWEQQLYRYFDGIRGGEGYFMGIEPPTGRRLPGADCPRPFTPGKEPVKR